MSAEDGLFLSLLKPGPRVRSALRGALDLVFPPQAIDGGAALAGGLSAAAWSRIQFLDGPVCDGCGAPFEFDIGSRCASCLAKPRAFDAARAACLYDEYSREPILKLKHADRTDLAPLFARWLSRAARDLIDEADAIAPVPLHPSRLLSRRYNQAAEIARPLARMTELAYLPDALIRRRATETQGGKSGVGRKRNVAGAFEVPHRRAQQVRGRRILLIDDVMTTGSTAEGCARALKAAGAVRVDVAVVARVKEMSGLAI
ncbi:ComF family protein [Phenylobacterium sp.]|jgi:ComF family protein|uniref:ComF family protein n=1 Tax=Phenylobacterium sp. TaxID=1871053 RepID=UPI002E372EA6|nr:phosphoribosyltransferase family protein [Phenylobacterium sp.]HEX3363535.1 phosphoribosyltransferase family protein [Phenylobacterium sp.]